MGDVRSWYLMFLLDVSLLKSPTRIGGVMLILVVTTWYMVVKNITKVELGDLYTFTM